MLSLSHDYKTNLRFALLQLLLGRGMDAVQAIEEVKKIEAFLDGKS